MLRLSQTALGEAIGVTFQQIQKYERGANRISFSRLVEIAQALGCRVLDLIGDLDDGGKPRQVLQKDTADLRQPGARQLLEAYAATPAPMRKLILSLAKEIAGTSPG